MDQHNIPQGADIFDSTWAMKKKANGEYHARLATRGFKQTQGKSFVHHNISSLVEHDITVRIILVLTLMENMITHLVGVNGAFLLGKFKPDEKIYMEIQKLLSARLIVVFKMGFVWCQNYSKSILEITSWNHEQQSCQSLFVLQMGQ